MDKQLAFVQVMRDVTSVREAAESGTTALSSQYRALRCRVDAMPFDSPELTALKEQFETADGTFFLFIYLFLFGK